MSKRPNILLWVSRSGSDLDASAVAKARPDLVVRLSTSAVWPAQIGGVTVRPIYEMVDAGIVNDRSQSALAEWMRAASWATGADGKSARQLRSKAGLPLWWCVDSALRSLPWLRIRTIEAVFELLERMRPSRVTVWGHNEDHYWIRSTVSQILQVWNAHSEASDISMVPAWGAAAAQIRPEWRKRSLELAQVWLPSCAAEDVSLGFSGSGWPDPAGPAFTTEGPAMAFAVSTSADAIEARVRWRRGYGFGIGLEIDTGRRRGRLLVSSDGIRLDGAERAHTADMSTFHDLALEICSDRSCAYLDGRLVLEGECHPGMRPGLRWGHLEADELTRAEWLHVAWGTRESKSGFRNWVRRRFTRRDSAVQAPADRPSVAPLLTMPPRSGVALPPHLIAEPAPGDVLVIGWGALLQWHIEADCTFVDDPYAEGIMDGLRRAGLPTSFLAMGAPTAALEDAATDASRIRQLSEFWPQAPTYEHARDELLAEWRAWRDGGARFPDYRGVGMDDFVAPYLERYLGDIAIWIRDMLAFERYLDQHRPRAVIFSNLASSHRHLTDAAHRYGALAFATTIGVDLYPPLLYGLDGSPSECPRAAAYVVWGEWQKEQILAGASGLTVAASGRTRQDTFARLHGSPPPGLLQRLGLPDEVSRVLIFGDVLRGTLKENILTQSTWLAVVRAMLDATVDRPDLHVVIKPWPGDSLADVRSLAGGMNEPRLHVLDPYATPLHNAELLAHTATVVSSATSFLAEFAAMGGCPILLSFPETRFYHGQKLDELYAGFCHLVEAPHQVNTALRSLLSNPDSLAPGAAQRERALGRLFGPSDGCSADRYAAFVRDTLDRRAGGPL